MALRAMKHLNVDLGFLTEATLTDGIHTRWSSDYSVAATNARAHYQDSRDLCLGCFPMLGKSRVSGDQLTHT
jgi:hypothetical protein